MKPKKFTKKLSVNKKTIVNLQNDELKSAKGGYPSGHLPCGGTFLTICCPTTMMDPECF